jgi:hypothetical protein
MSSEAVPVLAMISVLVCNSVFGELPVANKSNLMFEWSLHDNKGGLLLDVSAQAIYVLRPKQIENWLSDSVPLNLSLIVRLTGYKGGSASILILKSRVLDIPSWIQFKPLAVDLPLNESILLVAAPNPPRLLKREHSSYMFVALLH